jgi:hypothetical protein
VPPEPAGPAAEERADDQVDVLRRWEAAGALWRVVRRSPGHVEVALLTCDAGEEMDRLTSEDPEVLAYVGDRTASDA